MAGPNPQPQLQLPEGAPPPDGQEPHAQNQSGDGDQLDIEIVIAGEGDQPEAQNPPQADTPPAAAPQDQQPKPQKRPRSDPQRRIDQLTAQKAQIETTAQRLFRENEELRAQNEKNARDKAEADALAKKNERIATNHYVAGLTAQQEVQQRNLNEAIATGDVVKQGAATAKLAELAAEAQSTRNWLAN